MIDDRQPRTAEQSRDRNGTVDDVSPLEEASIRAHRSSAHPVSELCNRPRCHLSSSNIRGERNRERRGTTLTSSLLHPLPQYNGSGFSSGQHVRGPLIVTSRPPSLRPYLICLGSVLFSSVWLLVHCELNHPLDSVPF